MKNFLTKNFKIILATLCALLLACAGLFFVSFSTANAATGSFLFQADSSSGTYTEIAETELPSDLRIPQIGEDLSGRTVFVSSIAATTLNLVTGQGPQAISFGDTYAVEIQKSSGLLKIFLMDLHKLVNIWELVYQDMTGTTSSIPVKYFTAALPEDCGEITSTNLVAASEDVEPYIIKISDTYDAAADKPSDIWESGIKEVAENQVPEDLRDLDHTATEDLAGKYIFIFPDLLTETSFYLYGPDDIYISSARFSMSIAGISQDFEPGKIYCYKFDKDTTFKLQSNSEWDKFDAKAIQVSDIGPIDPAEPDDGKTSVGDWFNNLGETVSAWLNDNVGLAISGSGVLVIGGIILFFIIFRKRR